APRVDDLHRIFKVSIGCPKEQRSIRRRNCRDRQCADVLCGHTAVMPFWIATGMDRVLTAMKELPGRISRYDCVSLGEPGERPGASNVSWSRNGSGTSFRRSGVRLNSTKSIRDLVGKCVAATSGCMAD